ncbi:MAG TPA: alpha/beta hydrolase [Nevskiaceae bacterium]|nr:alpha/beta hydrolase [Nevskiaceae bacterium]
MPRTPPVLLSLALLALSTELPAASGLRIGELSLSPCEIGAPGQPPLAAQCTSLDVAENPQAPAARRLSLALAVLPSRHPQPQADPVVFLAGGPGQSARESYAMVAPALEPLRRERHVVLLDQRGTGGSNRLACPLPDWRDPAQQSLEAAREQAQQCRDLLAARADLSRYTTSEAVGDLETLRQALGAPALNLIGGSYGTRVGLEYLRRYPAQTRSLVIDGVVPPELVLLQEHARNLETSLREQFDRCARAPACQARFGDPQRLLDEALESLAQTPLTVRYRHPRSGEPREERLDDQALRGLLRLYAYSPEAASLLPQLLAELKAGRPEALAAQLEMLGEDLEERLAHGMELSVICAEDEPLLQPDPADALTVMGDRLGGYVQAQCAVWPRGQRPADFKQPVVAERPVLVLSGEHDPVTPPRYGEQVLKTLAKGRHLIARGQGHIVMARGCLPRLLRQFIETADATALDASCLDSLGDTPFFLSNFGPAP